VAQAAGPVCPLALDSYAAIRKQKYLNNSRPVTFITGGSQVIEASGFQGRSPCLGLGIGKPLVCSLDDRQ
jgi:hypothetical protein